MANPYSPYQDIGAAGGGRSIAGGAARGAVAVPGGPLRRGGASSPLFSALQQRVEQDTARRVAASAGGTSRATPIGSALGSVSSSLQGPTVGPQSAIRSASAPGGGGAAGVGAMAGGGGGGHIHAGGGGGGPINPASGSGGTPGTAPNPTTGPGGSLDTLNNTLNGVVNPTGSKGGASTQFGKTFVPGAYEELWSNPEALIQAYFDHRGMQSDSGMLPMMMDKADNLGLLWMASQSGGANFGDAADFADWSGNYLNNQMRPGGAYMNPQQVMQAILSPHADSALHQQFNSAMLKPSDQVGNVLQAVRYGLEGVMPTPMLNAVLTRLTHLGNTFIAKRLTSTDDGQSYTQYLASQGITPGMFV